MSSNFKYYMPTQISFGEGSLNGLKDLPRAGEKILLVIGQNFLRRNGWLKIILKLLDGHKVIIYDGVAANPDIQSISKGLSLTKKHRISLVIGVGGGSVLDCAKAIAVLTNKKGDICSYLDKKLTISRPGLKYIAIPTTAGSSSEVTPYSVITVPKRGLKVTLAHKYMYPSLAIIDPSFLNTLSPGQIANPGIDVLCHAIESYWNINHNPISDIFALKAIRLIFENLPKFYKNQDSAALRMKMAQASLFAGLAFSNTRTTACHSISYPLTTIFGVSHGQACAVTLSEMLLYNARDARERVNNITNIIGTKSLKATAQKIKDLMLSIGLKVKLSNLGLEKKDLSVILKKGFTPERMINNPRKVTRSAMKGILLRSF